MCIFCSVLLAINTNACVLVYAHTKLPRLAMSIERPLAGMRMASHAGSSAHAERKRNKLGRGYWFSGSPEAVALRSALLDRVCDLSHARVPYTADKRAEWMVSRWPTPPPVQEEPRKRKRETVEVQEAFEMARASAERELKEQQDQLLESRHVQIERAAQVWRDAQPFLRPEPDRPGYHQCATHRCNDCVTLMSTPTLDPKEKRRRKKVLEQCTQCAVRTCRQVQLEVRCYETKGAPHLCVLDMSARHTFCRAPKDSALHRTLQWTEEDVYMCSITGRAHYCGARCQLGIRTKATDFLYMCPVTGMSDARDARMLDTFGREAGDTQDDPCAQPNERMHEPDPDARVIPTMQYVSNEWLERLVLEAHDWPTINAYTRKTLHDLKRHDDRLRYLIVCLARVWSMFCPARYAQDMTRMMRVKRVAHAAVERYLQQSYSERDHSLHPTPLSLQHMRTVHHAHVFNKRFSPPLERRAAPAFVLARAKAVLKLWYLLRQTRDATRVRDRRMRELPIGGFVEAAMNVLAAGVTIPATDRHASDVVVLNPDASLQMLLPDDSTMRKVSALDIPKSSRTRGEIVERVKQAVRSGTPVHRFDLSALEFERMDASAFRSCK